MVFHFYLIGSVGEEVQNLGHKVPVVLENAAVPGIRVDRQLGMTSLERDGLVAVLGAFRQPGEVVFRGAPTLRSAGGLPVAEVLLSN